MKKVLILSSSPRRGGNSDTLCDEFLRGAIKAGNNAEKFSFVIKPFTTAQDAACVVCMASPVLKKTMQPK